MARRAPTRRAKGATPPKRAESYKHPDATSLLRPDVGTQAQFRKRKAPARYRYDSSLSPALDWDGQNPAREQGEEQLAAIRDQLSAIRTKLAAANNWDAVADNVARAEEATRTLRAMSGPFLNWAGKAERLSFDVPTLPLFVHERLSTKAILETLKGHKRDKQLSMFELFGDQQYPIHDQVLRAYEYPDNWVNRVILGDSLVVMNSLLHYESLGGQVQMIYMDPPYGVQFGSNFQPFVRKRDVKHNDDTEMTREPEMVKAYRDTWELGLHSYLTYLRDRLLLCRELLAPSGSIFVQISDENAHHVRELMSEIFGAENVLPTVVFRKTTGAGSPSGYVEALPQTFDFLLWYAKDRDSLKVRRLYLPRDLRADVNFRWLETPDGTRRVVGEDEDVIELSRAHRVFQPNPLTSQTGGPTTQFEFEFEGTTYKPSKGGWKTNREGMLRLTASRRLMGVGRTLRFIRYHDDFTYVPVIDIWDDTRQSGFGEPKLYAVQTASKVVQRCLLLVTDPGDLVLDPTCVRRGTLVLTPLNPPASGGRAEYAARGESAVPTGEWRADPPAEGRASTPSPRAGRVGVGSVPVEHLRPGDQVYAHDGTAHRVLRTLRRRYSGPMIGLRRAGCDETLWLTADHLVLSERYVRQLGTPGQPLPPRVRGGPGWGSVPPKHFGRARDLRRSPSPPEALLWQRLRSRAAGVKFRRQHPIGPYIADFYSRQAALVIEVDGEAHYATEEAMAYDRERDRYMEGMGLRVLRFPAAAISSATDAVAETIADRAREAVLDDDSAKQWRRADHLKVGDVVFAGVEREPWPIVAIERQESVEEVYDLEVEGAHSFLTEVCAVHNCGSGTTAYVAEQWGRRWITIDTSRVPLALARQRLLTATFPFYQLKEEKRGPAGGFVYLRKQNSKGEEVGGIVPHVTLKSIANNEPPEEEVLVDRPEVESKITRVTGPFCVEATIPTPVDWEGEEPPPLIPPQAGGEPAPAEGGGSAPSPHAGRAGVGLLPVESYGSFVDRMIEVLRKSPVLHIGGGKTVTLRNVRPPAKTLSLSAEAVVVDGDGTLPPLIPPQAGGVLISQAGGALILEAGGAPAPAGGRACAPSPRAGGSQAAPSPRAGRAGVGPDQEPSDGVGVVSEPSADRQARPGKPVAIVFGPENGAVSERLVYEAAREAYAKSYTHLYVIGFAIQPNARELVEKCEQVVGVSATYVQATPDLMMGDLLKNMRSSQIFSVCGLPEVRLRSLPASGEGRGRVGGGKTPPSGPPASGGKGVYQVELVGLDVFDPATMEAVHRSGDDVPAWFLDTDYNGLCFHVCQAFFPRTAAWDDLKRALKGEYEDSVWEHLAGTVSAPFEAGEHGQIAVKVIDDRGNELLVVKDLKDAGHA